MIYRACLAAAVLAAGAVAVSSPAEAQRQSAQPVESQALPLCREAEPGERCRTRNGVVRIRRDPRSTAGDEGGQTNNLGGGDPGWEVRDTRRNTGDEGAQINNLGGGDPGWELQGDCDAGSGGEEAARPGQQDVQNFGGADVGFVTGPGDKAPEAAARSCD